MPLWLNAGTPCDWRVRKIVVVGPGIVGMPMAAMLAHARITEGSSEPAEVVVVQRGSPTSGWKVDSINAGRSPIGGVEPDLDRLVAESVEARLLRASHDYAEARDADVVVICVQTDKAGLGPDYEPLLEALTNLAEVLRGKPAANIPLVIIESTLAPSSMATVVRDLFAEHDLLDGRDVLLGNSPNRVMPGRLVERVASADKLVAGLEPATSELIARLYRRIVTRGALYQTNSLTAEVVKTVENAYRDIRIAYAAEVARYCDAEDIDFYQVREAVNHALAQADAASSDGLAVPTGALLVPTIGVGGHCLPKDGILLLWRWLECGGDTGRSLILESRRINDESPAATIDLAERDFGPLAGRAVALLGAAYRFNSEDTRNSPTLALARLLLDRGCRVAIQDPYVYPTDQNLRKYGLENHFTRSVEEALGQAEIAILCTAHQVYRDRLGELLAGAPRLAGLFDGCNLVQSGDRAGISVRYGGIGRGRRAPTRELINRVAAGFGAVERGFANELRVATDFLNQRYTGSAFARVDFATVQRVAGTCATGCRIAEPGPVAGLSGDGFRSRLVSRAAGLPAD